MKKFSQIAIVALASVSLAGCQSPFFASLGFDSPEYWHLFVEAKKLAFEDRAKFYADPDFNDIPVDWLVSEAYAAERRALIDRERAGRSYPAGKLKEGDTIYLTVADKDGNMVSLIQSNYRGMGSGMTPGDLGFVLQNRAELFNGDINIVELPSQDVV